jgi:O-antigen/teichoic acid export membrane protein
MLLERSPSLLNLGVLITACNLVEHAALAGLAFRLLPMRLSRRLVDRATMRRVRGYSLDAFLAMVAGRACVQSGAVIAGLALGETAVTYFGIASRLVEFAKALLRTATNTLTPAISSLEAAGDTAAIRRLFLRGTRWVLYLILPVHLGLVVFGQPFLTIWMGDARYAERCYPPLVILASTLTLVVAQSVASRVLYGTGRLRGFARMAMVEAAVNVALSVTLCVHFGLVGLAIGVAVPNLLMCLWVIGYTSRGLGVSWRQYVSDGWSRPMILATIPLAVWLLADVSVAGWGDLSLAIGMGLLPYGLALLVAEGKLGPRTLQLKRAEPEKTVAAGF